LKKLENNTSVNLNFYNTYGQSKYYRLSSGILVNTDMHIKLSIKLIDTYTTDLDFKIKNFILDFIEKINGTSNKTFAISNLTEALESEFDDIQYIEFEELNGNELTAGKNQVIVSDCPPIEEMTKEQLINYIPEFLNVHIEKETYIEGKNNFVVGIDITYK